MIRLYMTSWHGSALCITGHVWGESLREWNPPVTGWFPKQASDAVLWCAFDVNPNKLLNKQVSYRYFETPWVPYDARAMRKPHAWIWECQRWRKTKLYQRTAASCHVNVCSCFACYLQMPYNIYVPMHLLTSHWPYMFCTAPYIGY